MALTHLIHASDNTPLITEYTHAVYGKMYVLVDKSLDDMLNHRTKNMSDN